MTADARTDQAQPIPVIIDTDAGGDIDDTWALAMLMRCPELATKLVLTSADNPHYGAAYVARVLQAGGHDLPIGVGLPMAEPLGSQAKFIEDFDINSYPGEVIDDGVGALIDTVMRSVGPMTLLAIGPCQNVAEALRREPRIAQKLHYVGMQGSIREGHKPGSDPIAEYNVRKAIPAAQQTFAANWLSTTITPLDTCAKVVLQGPLYRQVREAATDDPMLAALMEAYDVWAAAHRSRVDVEQRSSQLFDTVAVYLCFADSVLEMETLPLVIDDDGRMHVDPSGQPVRVASRWRDMAAFERFLVDRLVGAR